MSSTDQEDELKSLLCPGCNKSYEFQVCLNIFTGRVPLILHCKHTLCEECLKINFHDKEVICADCKEPSVIPEGKRKLQEIFPVNFYILGKIAYLNPKVTTMMGFKHRILQSSSKSSVITTSQESLIHNILTTKYGPCSQKHCNSSAKLRCKDCEENFCENCCKIIHEMAKGLKLHKICKIGVFDASDVEIKTKCTKHKNEFISFYCKTCDLNICCFCILQLHNDHEYIQLNNLKWCDIPDFENLIQLAEEKVQQLMTAKKKIHYEISLKHIKRNSTPNMTISNFFNDLHGKLQLLENEIKKEYEGEHDVKNNELFNIQNDIENNINTLEALISIAKDICVSKDIEKLNVKKIQEKLKDYSKIPSYLIFNKEQMNSTKSLFANKFLDDIEDHIKNCLVVDDDEVKLVSADELPEDYNTEKEMEVPENYVLDTSVEDEPFVDIASSSSRDSLNEAQNFVKLQQQMPVLAIMENDLEIVTVTHINSPDSFYVQLNKSKRLFQQLIIDIKSYIKSFASYIRHPKLDEIYLVKYRISSTLWEWSRAKIIEIITSNTEILYDVFFIDYGNTQKVKVQNLRDITDDVRDYAPFALHCKLWGVYPKHGEWKADAKKVMAQIIQESHINNTSRGNETSIQVNSIDSDGIFEVELVTFDHTGSSNSIREYLYFTGHAILDKKFNDITSNKTESKIPSDIRLLKTENYKVEESSFVCLTYVNEDSIFINDFDAVEEIKKMHELMKKHYNNNKQMIFMPKKGMEVAVDITDYKIAYDGPLYRGEVKELLYGEGMVTVFLVDIGKYEKVNPKSLRILSSKFKKLECQAKQVSLADIKPTEDNNSWNSSAVDFLTQYVENQQQLLMLIKEITNPVSVILFEPQETVDLCINAVMVKKGIAELVGETPLTIKWKHKQEETSDDSFTINLLKTIQSNKDENIKVIKAKTAKKIKKDSLQTPISIILIESPDSIYVRVMSDMFLTAEQKLYSELQAHYKNNKSNSEMNWNVNDQCVVFYKKKNGYFRAIIIEELENDQYRVKLIDFAVKIIITKQNIFTLDGKFKSEPSFAVKCHLFGISPTGDKTKWSLLACDYIKDTLKDKKELFMTKKGPVDLDKKSMPVIIWYNEQIHAALEPIKTNTVYIQELLIENGLAFRNKELLMQSYEETDETEVKSNDGNSSNSCDTGNIKILNEETEEMSIRNSLSINKPVKNVKKKSKKHKLHVTENVINDYPPAPKLLKNVKFTAFVTYISEDGYIYIQNCDVEKVYEAMVDKMKTYFDELPYIEDIKYSPNDLCTVQYVDTNWYRAKIKEIHDDDTYTVSMTDFGNEELVTHKQIRNIIMYPDIPVLTQKIKLYRVFTKNNKWKSTDIEMLQKKLDNIKILVHVYVEELPKKPALCILHITETNENINDFVLQKCPYLNKPLNQNNIPEINEDSDVVVENESIVNCELETTFNNSQLCYPLPTFFNINEKLNITVVDILNYNKIIIDFRGSKENVNTNSLTEDKQCLAGMQPKLHKFESGTACIVHYKQSWHRAEIIESASSNSDNVQVLLIDNGNFVTVRSKSIYEILPEWLNIPRYKYLAEIYGIDLTPYSNLNLILNNMNTYCGKAKIINIIKTKPLVVELYEEDKDELCYSHMISCGLLAKTY